MLYQNFPAPMAHLVDEIAAHMNGRDKNRFVHSLETALPAYVSEADFDIILKQFLYDVLLQKAKPLVPKRDKELATLMDDTIDLFKRAMDGHPPSVEDWNTADLEAYALATSSKGRYERLAYVVLGAVQTDAKAPAATVNDLYVALKKTKRNTTEFWRWAADLLLTLFRKAGVPQFSRPSKALAA